MADAFIRAGTEAAVTIPEIWSAKVYAALRKALSAALLVDRTYEGEIKAKGDKVHICSLPAYIATADVTEGTAVEAVASTWTDTELVINKHKAVHVAVSDVAQLQASINLIDAYSEVMGASLAKAIDSDLITTLKGASAAAPDHIIAGSGGSGVFAPLTDILTAKGLLDAQDVPQDSGRWMLMSPADYNKILAVTQVQSADYQLMNRPMVDGKIPPIFGFTPYSSTQMTTGEVIFGHITAAVFAMQKEVTFRTVSMLAAGIHADRLVADCLYGSKIMDSGKRVVLLNATGA
jgi:hypothetical protein